MNEKPLHDLLEKYNVKPEYLKFVGAEYKSPIDDFLCSIFPTKPHIRYGGSIAKHTANSNSSDIDLLCYYDSSFKMSVENIFDTIVDSLRKAYYIYRVKNCAICVLGKYGEDSWDVEIDIVPGKYIDNDNNDVNIWQSRTKSNLKTNPIKQLEIVKKSKMKDVIRLIKLYKNTHDFRFKSFFLEMFCVQVIEPLIKDDDSLYQKLITFCSHYDDIGKIKVVDPANEYGNNIMKIYSEEDYEKIRSNVKYLYEVMLTGNVEALVKTIEDRNYRCSIESLYKKDAKSHSFLLKVEPYINSVQLSCKGKDGNITSGQVINKGLSLRFNIFTPFSCSDSDIKLIVSNAGYEARNCKRGGENDVVKIDSHHFYRNETTSFNGDHFVQAILRIGHSVYYSNLFVVRIRDYN